ncbi:hypothetical protein B1R32_10647 [Abditibacterium utsteinense]|uniref:Uncharacterized protein n=1 Tax=Abditibacterium utsteinense TaxID=1960156 RepID=A0A2S8STR9_9BACT|nr:hypothetical protein [Abditibacterium utsteinense]PQV64203.1 hypothetical protein B1R32_10647 [Abditibacterium utsteinense]
MPNFPLSEGRDLFCDTWVATDALGRDLPLGGEVRAPQKDKFVGVFYFVWQGFHENETIYDLSKIIAANPKNPAWGPPGAFHWWGEPEIGYFRATAPWVARRNLSMMAVAGVDCLFVDVTNSFTYPEEMKVLFEAARQMRAEGNATPQIAFILNADAVPTVKRLWNEWYQPNLYSELWFRWQGKPLILGDIFQKTTSGEAISREIQDFFTWRHSWFETDPQDWFGDGQGKWPWRDKTPQNPGLSPSGAIEQVAVGVASHPIGENIGRSYADATPVPIDEFDLTKTYALGIQFEEQWQRALEIDPPLVFVTGWNEWVAQRQITVSEQVGDVNMLGRSLQEGDTFFVDLYNAEFSRDADAMKGGYTDNYYWQLVANIRKFKGARHGPRAETEQTIDLDADFSQWQTVAPEFRSPIGDTMHRDHPGWGGLHYKNETGRNDIVVCKVARDAHNFTFYAQTQADLSPRDERAWMLLFINADQNARTGWNGYNFRVNAQVGEKTTSLENWTHGAWHEIAQIPYRATKNEVHLAIPRALLGQNQTECAAFDFKWADNIDLTGNSETFFLDGNCAPPRRFNFRYSSH